MKIVDLNSAALRKFISKLILAGRVHSEASMEVCFVAILAVAGPKGVGSPIFSDISLALELFKPSAHSKADNDD